jgi:phosphopantothenoylcysteine decarboxylase / phosphopantothenate---cysteine ligase
VIILGISGSIAAYKIIELAKLFVENKIDFRIILSKSAPNFVSPMLLKSLFPKKIFLFDQDLGDEDEMLHISLAKQAKLILIAPASANMISKISHAQADCLLSTVCLASEAPIIIAPAMNKVMWENKLVQNNVAKFQYVIGPASGKQACGDNGLGRMVEPQEMFEYIKYFYIEKSLQNKKILITSGPTIENIDPVRFLSNYSSGKMGYAIAKIASFMGAEVTLVSGPTSLSPPKVKSFINVKSAQEMMQICLSHAGENDIFISAAAVADYCLEFISQEKIKKSDETKILNLVKNPDIITTVKKEFPNIFAVGFAAETCNIKEYGIEKLNKKMLDMIAINDVSDGKVFANDYNQLHVITKNKNEYFIERSDKESVAQKLLSIISSQISCYTKFYN